MANEQLIKGAGYAAPMNAGLADYYLRTKAKGYGGMLPRGYGYPTRNQLSRFLDTTYKDVHGNITKRIYLDSTASTLMMGPAYRASQKFLTIR